MLDNLESRSISITFSFQKRYCGKLDRNSKAVRHSVPLEDAAPLTPRGVDPQDPIGLFIIIFRHSCQGRDSADDLSNSESCHRLRTGAKLHTGHGQMAAALRSLSVGVAVGEQVAAAELCPELHIDRGSVGGQSHGRAGAARNSDIHQIGSAGRGAHPKIVSGHSTGAGRPGEGGRCAGQRAAGRRTGHRCRSDIHLSVGVAVGEAWPCR